MKKVKISVAALMSFMLVASSTLVSCSTDDKTSLNDSDTAKNINASRASNDWFTLVHDNVRSLDTKFSKGINQAELDDLLVRMGYRPGQLSLAQFNEIYARILQEQNGNMDFDAMYDHYYGHKSVFFTNTIKDVFANVSIDSRIGTPDWNALTYEEQNLLLGLRSLVHMFPLGENSSRGGGFIIFGATIPVNEHVAVIGFYTLVGAGIGLHVGGPIGAGIGAVAGAIVGVVMDLVK